MELIRALDKIDIEERPVLNVIGTYKDTDPYVKKIFKEIKNKNLINFIRFYNQINDDEMIAIMDTSKVFILPSKNTSTRDFEGFGLVFLEASTRYLPVIGSYNCGNEDVVIDGHTGFLVKQGDIESLKNKLSYLLNNPDFSKKMGKNGKIFANKMTWNNTTEIILNNITI